MKISIEVDIMDFHTPEYVDLKDSEELVNIKELGPEILLELCDKFKDNVFKKAGKQFPPMEAPTCRKCKERF